MGAFQTAGLGNRDGTMCVCGAGVNGLQLAALPTELRWQPCGISDLRGPVNFCPAVSASRAACAGWHSVRPAATGGPARPAPAGRDSRGSFPRQERQYPVTGGQDGAAARVPDRPPRQRKDRLRPTALQRHEPVLGTAFRAMVLWQQLRRCLYGSRPAAVRRTKKILEPSRTS